MTTQQTVKKFVKALEENASKCDFDVRPNYQGRAMYGRTCVGVVSGFGAFWVASDIVQIVNELEGISEEERLELLEDIKGASSDNMGLDTIYYFRNISLDNKETNA